MVGADIPYRDRARPTAAQPGYQPSHPSVGASITREAFPASRREPPRRVEPNNWRGTLDHGIVSPVRRDLPPGFHYRDSFITEADERVLLDAMADIAFSDFEMRGVVARRRVAFFGQSYDRRTAGPIPAFLLPLRATIAHGLASSRSVRDGAHQRVRTARPSAGIATRRNTTSSQASRCGRSAE